MNGIQFVFSGATLHMGEGHTIEAQAVEFTPPAIVHEDLDLASPVFSTDERGRLFALMSQAIEDSMANAMDPGLIRRDISRFADTMLIPVDEFEAMRTAIISNAPGEDEHMRGIMLAGHRFGHTLAAALAMTVGYDSASM